MAGLPDLFILRPEPGCSATMTKAQALGFTAHAMPLFTVRPVAYALPPATAYDAILLTSANAVRYGGERLAQLRDTPVVAVGEKTAKAAQKHGFKHIVFGHSNAEEAIALAVGQGHKRLLHLAGRDHRTVMRPDVQIQTVITYASEESGGLRDDFESGVALVHSARAAERLALLCAHAKKERHRFTIAAISQQAGNAVGAGWAKILVAPEPNDEALLDCVLTWYRHGAPD